MDDYENILSGAGSAPTAAGGAASLGPDAAGYAPTAAATPTPRQTSPVDALAPLARQQATTALSLGASALSPENRQRWMPPRTEGDSLSALVPPTTTDRNLTDGAFTRPAPPPATMPDAWRPSDDMLVSRATDHLDAIGRQWVTPKAQEILGRYDWATKEMAKSDAMARLAESLRGGAQKGIEDFYRGREPGGSAPVSMPAEESRPVKMPTVDERKLRAPWEDSRRPVGNRYEYRGYQAELPSGVDLGDPAAVSRATAMNNTLIDWMFDNDEEEV